MNKPRIEFAYRLCIFLQPVFLAFKVVFRRLMADLSVLFGFYLLFFYHSDCFDWVVIFQFQDLFLWRSTSWRLSVTTFGLFYMKCSLNSSEYLINLDLVEFNGLQRCVCQVTWRTLRETQSCEWSKFTLFYCVVLHSGTQTIIFYWFSRLLEVNFNLQLWTP